MPETILLRAPNWLGDCVMCLPALDALKTALPGSRLIVGCREHLSVCFAAHPGVDVVITCPDSGGLGALPRIITTGRRLRNLGADIGLLFTNSFSTALWLWFTRTRQRVGYDRDSRGLLLTRAIPVTPALHAAHMTDYYLNLVAAVGANPGPGVPNPGAAHEPVIPNLTVPDNGVEEAAGCLEDLDTDCSRYAVLAPASAYGPVKDWPPAHYAQVASRLVADRKLAVIITGTAAQEPACRSIAATAGSRVFCVAGKTGMAGFLGLIAGASLFIGGDSGGAHVAASLGIPTIVIFGITEPSRTRPLGKSVRIIGSGNTCTPDLDDPQVQSRARKALENISVEEVMQAVSHPGFATAAGTD